MRIKDFLERREYEEAFQLIIETLRFIKPLSHDWHRLVDLAERVANNIGDTGRKCLALLTLAEILKDYSYYDYIRLKEIVKQLNPHVYDRELKGEIERRLKRLDRLESEEMGISDASKIKLIIHKLKREVVINPRVVSKLEWIYLNSINELDQSERVEIERFLKEYPPKLELEIKRLSNEPLLLPSALKYEITVENKGHRRAEHIIAIIELESERHKETKTIDLSKEYSLRLRPSERRTVYLNIPIDAPGKYKLSITIEYRDALGERYELRAMNEEINAEMLPVSQIRDQTQLDELSTAKRELFMSIDTVLRRLVALYSKFTNVKNVNVSEFGEDFHREYREILSDALEGGLLVKLKKTRDAYQKHMRGFKDAIELYEEIIMRCESAVSQLKSWRDDAIIVKRGLLKTSIELRDEVHRIFGDLARDIVRIKWFEDRDRIKKLLERLDRSAYLDFSDEIIRGEQNLLILLLLTKRSFNLKDVVELLTKIKSTSLSKSSDQGLVKELTECIKSLKPTVVY